MKLGWEKLAQVGEKENYDHFINFKIYEQINKNLEINYTNPTINSSFTVFFFPKIYCIFNFMGVGLCLCGCRCPQSQKTATDSLELEV